MTILTRRGLGRAALAASPLLLWPSASFADSISVPNYGSSVSALPWAVALAMGYFKDAGAGIDSIYATQGGTTDIRSMLAGNLPFTVTNLPTLLAANKSGAELRLVCEDVCTCANFVWVTQPNSPIKALGDLKGKTITFTSPHSTTQALDLMLVEKAGLKPDEVKLIATGTYGVALTALQNGGADVALLAEPNYTINKTKVTPLFWVSDVLPPVNNTIGATSLKNLKDKPQVIRGILGARAKAIDYMTANRHAAALATAKIYKVDAAMLEAVMDELMAKKSADGTPFWGHGEIYPASLDNVLAGLKLTGDAPPNSDWRALTDQSLLPEKLRVDLKKA